MHGFAKGFIGTLGVGLALMAPAIAHRVLDVADPQRAEPEPALRLPSTAREAARPMRRGRLRMADPGPVELDEPDVDEPDVEAAGLPVDAAKSPAAGETLDVRLVDAETGGPVDMRVGLWRLDLPETETLTAGDVAVEPSTGIGVGGLEFHGLPAGRYRLHCFGQRKGASDPPAFAVSGGRTEFAALVRPPREFRVWVEVYDENSTRLDTCDRRLTGSRSSSIGLRAPRWASPRRHKDEDRSVGMHVGIG